MAATKKNADTSKRRARSGATSGNAFVPVNSAVLDEQLKPGVDAYLPSQVDLVPERVFSRQQKPNSQLFERIEQQGISKVLIAASDQELFNRYLSKNWEVLLSKTGVSDEQRFAILSEVVRSKLDHEFRLQPINTPSLVATSRMLSSEICAQFEDSPIDIETVKLVLNHDSSLATHATKCATLCCILGKAMHYTGEDLRDLVHGAMLQDVGMTLVPRRHWQKKSKLLIDDLREIRRHPSQGFSLLLNQKMVSCRALLMVYQHHEREDGSGYPVAIDSADLHPFSQIGAIIDVFSAMTSRRTHRLPWSWVEAADVLRAGKATRFNEEALKCWLRVIGI